MPSFSWNSDKRKRSWWQQSEHKWQKKGLGHLSHKVRRGRLMRFWFQNSIVATLGATQVPKNISPSALYTETAPPLPSPPEHLVNDTIIQGTIKRLGNHIKVETPFDIDKLESLNDHPNSPLVQSAMESLWEKESGHWVKENRRLRFREQSLERQSQEIDEIGMKISPMYVAWQHRKPQVITDHSTSELNAESPWEDAKVWYDDMCDFEQALHDAWLANVDSA